MFKSHDVTCLHLILLDPVHLIQFARHFNKRRFGRRLCFPSSGRTHLIRLTPYFELLSATDQYLIIAQASDRERIAQNKGSTGLGASYLKMETGPASETSSFKVY